MFAFDTISASFCTFFPFLWQNSLSLNLLFSLSFFELFCHGRAILFWVLSYIHHFLYVAQAVKWFGNIVACNCAFQLGLLWLLKVQPYCFGFISCVYLLICCLTWMCFSLVNFFCTNNDIHLTVIFSWVVLKIPWCEFYLFHDELVNEWPDIISESTLILFISIWLWFNLIMFLLHLSTFLHQNRYECNWFELNYNNYMELLNEWPIFIYLYL